MSPFALSLWIAVSSGALCLLPALAIGHWLARSRSRLTMWVNALVLFPVALPPVVTGLGLLGIFGRRGLLGAVLHFAGLGLPFTTSGAVLVGMVVGFPLFALTAKSAFEMVDVRYEEVAVSLGASRLRTFFAVTLPLASRAIGSGASLAFARILGEFGATSVFAGDVPGQTRTLALAIYASLESPGGEPRAFQLASLSVALSMAALIAHGLLTRRDRA